MSRSWLEPFDALLRDCSLSAAIGGGFPGSGGRLRFVAGIDTDRMKSLQKRSHLNAVMKQHNNGDFYRRYHGSLYRKSRSGELLVVRWELKDRGSWG
jgi:hypothetical protein